MKPIGLSALPVADLRQGGREGVKILSISCSFWENLAKSYVDAPPGVGAPSSGKSWVRHWLQFACLLQRNIVT